MTYKALLKHAEEIGVAGIKLQDRSEISLLEWQRALYGYNIIDQTVEHCEITFLFKEAKK